MAGSAAGFQGFAFTPRPGLTYIVFCRSQHTRERLGHFKMSYVMSGMLNLQSLEPKSFVPPSEVILLGPTMIT